MNLAGVSKKSGLTKLKTLYAGCEFYSSMHREVCLEQEKKYMLAVVSFL